MSVTVDISSVRKRFGPPEREVLKQRTRIGFVFQDAHLVDEPRS
ncbi:hypothetical protein ABZ642_30695 [Streptomyces sp. NPDC007157]